VTKEVERDAETFFTDVGVQQAYEYEDLPLEYEQREEDLVDIDEIMAEIKKDVFKYKNGEEDDLAELRRMVHETDLKMKTYCPPNVEFGHKLREINENLKTLGCS